MIGGVQIIVSEHAVAKPKLKPPLTSDMADIVDAFDRAGLIVPVPASFMMGGQLVCHPVIAAELRKRLRSAKDSLQNDIERRMIYGAPL